MELRHQQKSALPLHFFYMAHLVIRVPRMLIALSCNLAHFHFSLKSYKTIIMWHELQCCTSFLYNISYTVYLLCYLVKPDQVGKCSSALFERLLPQLRLLS